MQIIASARRTGKTSQLIKMAAGKNGFIVVPHDGMADFVMGLAKEMGVEINRPVTIRDVLNNSSTLAGRKIGTPLFFDNVEMMLGRLAPRYTVAAMTVNTSEFPEEYRKAAYEAPTLTPEERDAAERKARMDCIARDEEIRMRGF